MNADPKSFLKILDPLDLDLDVRRRISIHLYNTFVGNDDVYMSPIAKDHGAHSILEDWNSIFEANKGRLNQTLIDLELSNLEKFGPRSISVPWDDRREAVADYFKVSSKAYPDLRYNSKLPVFRRLRPLPVREGIKFLKNNTNSGLPYYTRKSKIKSKLESDWMKLLARRDPCILFTRTQESRKTRAVWGYPVADTLREALFYRPVLDVQRKRTWRSALSGPDEVDKKITAMIDHAIALDQVLVSLDFSSYDATVGRGLQYEAFRYISCMFQEKYWDDIYNIGIRFSTIPLLTPDGILKGKHGIPSGSTFTNEVGSIVQYLIAMSTNLLDEDSFQIQGDDGAYRINRNLVSELFDSFESYGLKVNRDKSYVDNQYLVYLQSLYHIDYRDSKGKIGGIYPVYRALNRILFQERWSTFEDFDIQGRDYYSLRTISILENCKHHPLFKELVEFVFKLDKYNLGYSRNGLSKFVNYVTASQGAEGILINQYGDNVKGINSFETVKLIKTLV